MDSRAAEISPPYPYGSGPLASRSSSSERDRLVRRQDDTERHGPVGRGDLEPGPGLRGRASLQGDEPAVLDLDRPGLAHRHAPPFRPSARARAFGSRRPLMISDSDRRTTHTCWFDPDRATSTTSRSRPCSFSSSAQDSASARPSCRWQRSDRASRSPVFLSPRTIDQRFSSFMTERNLSSSSRYFGRAAAGCPDGERKHRRIRYPVTTDRKRGCPAIGRRGSVVIVAVLPGVQQRLPVLFSLQDVVDAGIRVTYLWSHRSPPRPEAEPSLRDRRCDDDDVVDRKRILRTRASATSGGRWSASPTSTRVGGAPGEARRLAAGAKRDGRVRSLRT